MARAMSSVDRKIIEKGDLVFDYVEEDIAYWIHEIVSAICGTDIGGCPSLNRATTSKYPPAKPGGFSL